MTRKVGYLRVSTHEQRLDRQIDALSPLCDELHLEKLSAVARKRPVYERVVEGLRAGDTMVVLDLDRAFRSTVDAITEAEKLRQRGVQFRIVNLNVDTSTPAGMLVYSLIGALAEYERRTLAQRTREGLAAARKRGVRLGRPPKLTDKQLLRAKRRIANDEAIGHVAKEYGVTPWTLSRALNKRASTVLTVREGRETSRSLVNEIQAKRSE